MSTYITAGPFQDYLPGMYARCKLGEDTLSAAIDAASLATFARQSGLRRCMERGRTSYVVALSRINMDLAHPNTAVLDQTLASILLLGIFETIVFPGARSPEEWNAHLLGASKLLQLRGATQFKSDLGSKLFTHAASNIRASSMQRFVDLPAGFQTLNGEARLFIDPEDPGNIIGPICDAAIQIKARISNYRSNRNVLYDVFDDAVNLERKAAALITKDHPELGYTVRSADETPAWAYHGVGHRYRTHRASKISNTIRMVRLFLLEVMSAGAAIATERLQLQLGNGKRSRESDYFASQKEDVRLIAAEVTEHVLASIADFVEPGSGEPKFCPNSRTLMWPLSVIHKNRICPTHAREYARSMANKILENLDRLHPVDVRKVINEQDHTEDW
jgi:hypothetical protein